MQRIAQRVGILEIDQALGNHNQIIGLKLGIELGFPFVEDLHEVNGGGLAPPTGQFAHEPDFLLVGEIGEAAGAEDRAADGEDLVGREFPARPDCGPGP